MILLILLIGAFLTFIVGLFKFNDEQTAFISFLIATITTLSSTFLVIITLPKDVNTVLSSIFGTWINVGNLSIEIFYYLDMWSLSLLIVSSILTTLIVLFSFHYIHPDRHTARYYTLVQLFLFGMILLVVSNSLPVVLLGWEIVGLCSFSLISFYYHKPEIRSKVIEAGKKALFVTGFADLGLFISIAVLIYNKQSINLDLLLSGKISSWVVSGGFLLAAMGKSAQFPLHFWIASRDDEGIDAMQGPTTVSALIHAATMVNAGIYLLGRTVIITDNNEILFGIAVIGGITAILAAIAAIFVTDLKRILAYSTISQLGFMTSAVIIPDTGNFISLFHLVNHAFFKALLFLLAAVMIHHVGSRQLSDLRGHANDSRISQLAWIIGLASLVGIPLFSGFFSKELIIEGLWHSEEFRWLALILVFASVCTAIYAGRLFEYLFNGKTLSHQPTNLHYIVLSILVFFTLISTFTYSLLEEWSGVFDTSGHLFEFSLLSIIVPIMIGIGLFLGYNHSHIAVPDWLVKFIQNGYGIETIISRISEVVVSVGSDLSVRLQTGKFYWNMFYFAVTSTVLLGAIYLFQYGGIL